MRSVLSIGDCPECKDELVMYRSRARNRFIKCENPDCEFSYPIPKYGKVETTFLKCPETNLPLLMITKKNQNVVYFWTTKPCFTCSRGSSCEPVNELREEFCEDGKY